MNQAITTIVISNNLLLTSNIIILALNALLATFLIVKLLQLYQQRKYFHSQYHKLLTEASKEASQILHSTTQKAQEITSSIQNETNNHKTYLQARFEQTVNKQNITFTNLLNSLHGNYTDFLLDLKTQLSQSANNINRILVQQGNQEIANFAHSLRDNTIISEKSFQKILKSKITQANQDIKEYKKNKFKEVDQSINGIISEISKQVLSEAISTTEHTNLIIDSLKQAKKNNLLATL